MRGASSARSAWPARSTRPSWRKQLRGLGYEVQSYRDGRSGRDRAVGIAGFQDEHLKHFSKRSREIEKALHAAGTQEPFARLAGQRRDAWPKEKGVDREALLWKWRTAAREMSGCRFRKPEKELLRRRELPRGAIRTALHAGAVNGAIAHLSERKTVFSRGRPGAGGAALAWPRRASRSRTSGKRSPGGTTS